MTSHDADEIRAAGTRLREIKQRRLVILRDLESVRAERDRLEAAEALGRRPALMRRLEELQGELNEAAAAYEARPTDSRAARLRRLTMEEIELRDLLRQAEESTGAGAS